MDRENYEEFHNLYFSPILLGLLHQEKLDSQYISTDGEIKNSQKKC